MCIQDIFNSTVDRLDKTINLYAEAQSKANPTNMEPERPIKTNSRIIRDEKYRKDMYLAFVRGALLQKSWGNYEPFEELVGQLDLKTKQKHPTTVNQLRLWINALSHVVDQLDGNNSALVDAILALPWSTLDASFVKSYTSFIGLLVSAHPEYLSATLEKCAQGLTYEFNFHEQHASLAEGSSSPVSRRSVYDRHHTLLQHLLNLIPTLPSALLPHLLRFFPHRRLSKSCQITYIRNLLRVTRYCSSLTERLLTVVIERAIQIDVEIQVEFEELEATEEENLTANEGVFDLDPFDTDATAAENLSDNDSGSDEEDDLGLSDISSDAEGLLEDEEDEPGLKDQQVDLPRIRDMVEKLDAVMKILFEYFSESSTTISSTQSEDTIPPTPNEEELRTHRTTQFFILLSIFDKVILRTLKSKCIQFLLFWYTSLDAQYLDVFQGMLISKAFIELDTPLVIRVTATSYIASFVSRATFVNKAHTQHIVHLFRQHLEDQLNVCTLEASNRPNASQYVTFYAVAQALFLIFCFRWRDLVDAEGDADDEVIGLSIGKRKWIVDLEIIPKIVNSVLNPLKICSQNVVQQFANVALKTGFLYVFPIIEANKRAEYQAFGASQATLILGDVTLHANLDTFFPFDPYRLRQSQSWIEELYRDWSSVAIEDGEEDSDEDEEEITEMQKGDVTSEGLGESFEQMSISLGKSGLAGP